MTIVLCTMFTVKSLKFMHLLYNKTSFALILFTWLMSVELNFFTVTLAYKTKEHLWHQERHKSAPKVLLAYLHYTLATNFLFVFIFAFSSLTVHLLLVQLYMSSFSSLIQWHHFDFHPGFLYSRKFISLKKPVHRLIIGLITSLSASGDGSLAYKSIWRERSHCESHS